MSKSVFVKFIFVSFLAIFVMGCGTTAIMEEGDKFAANGEWDEAVSKYTEIVRKEPDNIEFKSRYRRARLEAALTHYNHGEELRKGGDLAAALPEFQAALMLDNGLKKAESSMKETKRLLDSVYYYDKGLESLKGHNEKDAKDAFKKSLALNAANDASRQELEKLRKEQKVVMDGYELGLKSSEPITLEFRDIGVKKIFEVLSKLSGINFVFDEEVKDNKASVFLKNSTFQQALELILTTNKLSRKVVSENAIIIYPSTPQKRQQYEELMIKVFYLSNTDAKKTVNILRTMLKARDLQVHEELNAIVIRARPDVIELAEKILNATDLADSEVMLAVEIIEIDRNKAMNLGIDLSPDAITAAVPMTGGSIKLGDLTKLSSDSLLIGLPSAILNLKKEDLDANLLANPRIRVKNNGKAKIHIGDRVPIITTTVNQGVSTENIQYQDVGLKLNVEPTIRKGDDIDLKVGLEVSSLGTKTTTNSGSVVYQIGTRNADTTLRLHDGETQIIGGLISDEERNTVAKIPFLGDIPVLGRLFSRNESSKVKTDILLSITPHIIRRLEVPDEADAGFMSGRDEFPSTRPMLEGFSPDAMPPGIAPEQRPDDAGSMRAPGLSPFPPLQPPLQPAP